MTRKYRYLSESDRSRLAVWYREEKRPCDIALWLGVHTATIYTELKRGQEGGLDLNGRRVYDPVLAEQRVREGFERKRRKKARSKTAILPPVLPGGSSGNESVTA